MSIKTVDKRFALIASDGDILYPFQKSQDSTNRYGFALSESGGRDNAGAYYTQDIEEVVRHLVFDGWKARVTTVDKVSKQRMGSMGIGLREISGYWIADEFCHLVAGAKTAPSPLPRSSQASSKRLPYAPIENNTDSSPDISFAEPTTQDRNGEDKSESSNEDLVAITLLTDLDEVDSDSVDSDDPTERLDSRMSRIGQGKFRKNTIATWGGEEQCAVTGIAIREVLTASHIIPWSEDEAQRKRGCNGIILTAHVDRLFDQHLIGFKVNPEVDGCSLVVAPRLTDRFADLAQLGLTVEASLSLSKVKTSDRAALVENLRAHLEFVLANK